MAAQTSRDKKKKNVIDALNRARGMELNAITQYMNHHYNLANMDYGDMAAKLKLIAIDEMRHAEMFAERVKELGGEPTTQAAAKPKQDGEVTFIFEADTKLEDGAIDSYNAFQQICRESGDSISAKLLEAIIDDEQVHFNYFDSVREHIARLGETYLAQIAGTPSSTGIQYQGFVVRQSGSTQGGGAGPGA